MALIRFQIDLAIPEATYNAIPAARKIAARDAIRDLKSLAVRINEGKPEEEMTVKASWHRCVHDENVTGPCEPEQDI